MGFTDGGSTDDLRRTWSDTEIYCGGTGLFSYEMNLAMFVDTAADVVVMKNSGLAGGTDTNRLRRWLRA